MTNARPQTHERSQGATFGVRLCANRDRALTSRHACGDRARQYSADRRGYTISDGNEMIKLYHIEGLNHSDNMTIVYRPKEKIAINADICGRPAAGGNLPNVNANSVALFRNIRRLKLDVAQHVPIHGNPGPDVLGRSALRVSCKVLELRPCSGIGEQEMVPPTR